jgi:hypothetical protein
MHEPGAVDPLALPAPQALLTPHVTMAHALKAEVRDVAPMVER